MKKLICLASVLFCFASLVSCEGEEDSNYVAKNYLVGKFTVTQIGALNASSILNYEDVPTLSCTDDYTFNEDMTFRLDDRSVTDAVDCTTVTTTGTYAIVSGNIVLTYTAEGEEVTKSLDMLTLTDKELSVVYTDEATDKLVFLKMTRQMILAGN
jgi:hypothetical protein